MRVPSGCAFAGLLCLLGVMQAAAGTAAESFRVGMRAFHEANYQAAEESFRRAAELFGKGEDAGKGRTLLWLGLARLYQQKVPAAREDFRGAITADPRLDVDRLLVPPDLCAVFDEVRSSMSGEVEIVGGPPGAVVRVGGRPLLLPTKLRLLAGERVVEVFGKDGRVAHTQTLLVRPGVIVRLVVPTAPPSWLTRRRKAGIATMGGSVLLGIGALVMGLAAKEAAAEVNRLRIAGRDASERMSALDGRQLSTNVLTGLAAAGAATGLVLTLWPTRREGAARITPAGAGAMLQVQF